MASWSTGDILVNGARLHFTRTGGARSPLVPAHAASATSGLCWTCGAGAGGRLRPCDGDARATVLRRARNGLHPRADGERPAGRYRRAGPGAAGYSRPLDGWRYHACPGRPVPRRARRDRAGRRRALTDADFPRRQEGEENPFLARLSRLKPNPRRAGGRDAGLVDGRMPSWSRGQTPSFSSNLRAAQFHPPAHRLPNCCHGLRPALLITADLGRGAIVRPEMAAADAQQQMPQLQVAHIPGAGHSVRREQFGAYIAAVRSFLRPWAAAYRQADEHP